MLKEEVMNCYELSADSVIPEVIPETTLSKLEETLILAAAIRAATEYHQPAA